MERRILCERLRIMGIKAFPSIGCKETLLYSTCVRKREETNMVYVKTIKRPRKDGSVRTHHYLCRNYREAGTIKTEIIRPLTPQEASELQRIANEIKVARQINNKVEEPNRIKELETYTKIALKQEETINELNKQLRERNSKISDFEAQLEKGGPTFDKERTIEPKLRALISECLNGKVIGIDGKARDTYKVKTFAQHFLIPLLEGSQEEA